MAPVMHATALKCKYAIYQFEIFFLSYKQKLTPQNSVPSEAMSIKRVGSAL